MTFTKIYMIQNRKLSIYLFLSFDWFMNEYWCLYILQELICIYKDSTAYFCKEIHFFYFLFFGLGLLLFFIYFKPFIFLWKKKKKENEEAKPEAPKAKPVWWTKSEECRFLKLSTEREVSSFSSPVTIPNPKSKKRISSAFSFPKTNWQKEKRSQRKINGV